MTRNERQVSTFTFGRGAPVGRFLVIGAALALSAWALGLAVTRSGASATGELSVDVYLAQHRSVALSQVALVINVLLGVSVAPILLLAVAGLAAQVWRWVAGVIVLVVTGAGSVAAAAGKMLVQRPRPPGDLLHALVSETGADSYPSGHTAFAAGLLASAVLVSYVYGRSAWGTAVLGLPALVVVGVSRLYLGVHYLVDVLGSGLVVSASTLLLIGTYNAVWRVVRTVRSQPSSTELLGVPGLEAASASVGDNERRTTGDAVLEGLPGPMTGHQVPGQVAPSMDLLGGVDADTRR